MKVVVVTAFPHHPDRPQGGVEAVSVNLVRSLAQQQPELQVVVVTVDRDASQGQTSTWSGIPVHRLPGYGERLLRFAVGQGRRSVKDTLRGLAPDVVHSHDTYGLMVKGIPTPRVFTVHGFIHEDTRYDSGKFPRLRAWLWRRAELAAWADQPHIISINPFVRTQLKPYVTAELHDIENPVAPPFFQIVRSEGVPTIFCAAAIRRLKNILGLVQAFQRMHAAMPEAQLRIAGPESEPDYAREVRGFIEHHHLQGSVSLLGSLSGDQIRSELARASLFALISFQENAPMGIAEAMAAGLPVVTSNRCGMPFMIRHGQTGRLVDPENLAQVADALALLLSNQALRAEMGQGARRLALDRFHPERVAQRTVAVYRKALCQI